MKSWIKGLSAIVLTVLFFLPVLAFADLPVVPDMDPVASVLALLSNWKSSAPLVLGMGIVSLAVQVLKKFAPEFKYKRFLVTALSCAYGVILGVSQGMPPLSVILAVLVTGGGAVAIYEAFKGVSKVALPPDA